MFIFRNLHEVNDSKAIGYRENTGLSKGGWL